MSKTKEPAVPSAVAWRQWNLTPWGGEPAVRLGLRIANVRRSGARLMACPTQVNCEKASLGEEKPNDIDRLRPKWHAVSCPSLALGHTDTSTAGVAQGLNHRMLRVLDEVNPSPRLVEAGAPARAAFGGLGRGCWKKQMPSCNGMDRSVYRSAAKAGRLPAGGSSPKRRQNRRREESK
jgi:hypothetical protein